jgi:hypothetical protein
MRKLRAAWVVRAGEAPHYAELGNVGGTTLRVPKTPSMGCDVQVLANGRRSAGSVVCADSAGAD